MESDSQDRFVERFTRYQDRVYGYILTTLTNRSDAEEVFQQTALILWKKWGQFDLDRDFVRWACGIARNEVRNFLRKHRRRCEYLSEKAMDEIAETCMESNDLLEARKAALADCVDALQPHHRELLDLCYMGNQTIRSVAEQLNMKPNALYKKLRRIRRILYECVDRALTSEVRQ